jgi:hypothetical protein
MQPQHGERLGRALERFVSERETSPNEPIAKVVDRVALHFDLDAAESEWLLRNAARVEREAREGAR